MFCCRAPKTGKFDIEGKRGGEGLQLVYPPHLQFSGVSLGFLSV